MDSYPPTGRRKLQKLMSDEARDALLTTTEPTAAVNEAVRRLLAALLDSCERVQGRSARGSGT